MWARMVPGSKSLLWRGFIGSTRAEALFLPSAPYCVMAELALGLQSFGFQSWGPVNPILGRSSRRNPQPGAQRPNVQFASWKAKQNTKWRWASLTISSMYRLFLGFWLITAINPSILLFSINSSIIFSEDLLCVMTVSLFLRAFFVLVRASSLISARGDPIWIHCIH